jgi:CheY-like chemotaxis protein
LKILLAEDSETNQQLFVALLQRRGHEVVVASDGDEALDLARAGDFDLILMDVQMPGHDGLEVTRLLRAEEPQGRVVPPIIALTARATRADRKACLAAGMVDCITKPIHIQTFYDTMDRVMGVGTSAPGVDWAAALETVRGNRELLQRLVATSRKEIPGLVDGIRQALERGDLETVHRNAHTLRGITGHLGARQAEEGARQLETAACAANAPEAATVFSGLVRDIEMVLGGLAAGD